MQGTKHFGVHYAARSPLELVGFTNYDWVRDSIDRKSTSSYVFRFSHGPICWSIKKKHTIFLSSAEAEYRRAVNATTQCVWLQGILGEFGVSLYLPNVISCENQSAINIYTYPV